MMVDPRPPSTPAQVDNAPGSVGRRGFVRKAGFYAGAAVLAPSLSGLLACGRSSGTKRQSKSAAGYGPLVEVGPEIALPAGFESTVLSVEGQLMSDGALTPRAHDGMAVFPQTDRVIRLVRNHEDAAPPGRTAPLVRPDLAYDPLAGGGTTTLDVRLGPDGRPTLERDFVSLGGTFINCSGGPTPWGSWLSCEESTQGTRWGWSVPHGYIFEVRVDTDVPEKAVPLRAMGRFTHEAIAVDPRTGFVYETEDGPQSQDGQRRSGFYRFRPKTPGILSDGGVLEMLAVRGRPQVDMRVNQRVGEWLDVEWLPIRDPDPVDAGREPAAVFFQGYTNGAARFSRLEGCWFDDDSVYFHDSTGGDAELGQVWRYVPESESLVLVFESPSVDVLNRPDNITVSPRGGILICEDNSGVTHLRGLTRDGEIFPFAQNVLNNREFAGACFSPNGQTLFVNIQGDRGSEGPGNLSYTLAIWGPWREGVL